MSPEISILYDKRNSLQAILMPTNKYQPLNLGYRFNCLTSVQKLCHMPQLSVAYDTILLAHQYDYCFLVTSECDKV